MSDESKQTATDPAQAPADPAPATPTELGELRAKAAKADEHWERLLRSQSANNAQAGSADALKTGVAMIQNQFKAALVEAGLEELDATGKPFDPNWQEAVSHQESAAVAEGQVLQQLRKGYKFRDRLLRPATVVVAKQPAAPATEAASPTP